VIPSLKNRLRSSVLLSRAWRVWRGGQQGRAIRREYHSYAEAFERAGGKRADLTAPMMWGKVCERLRARGITLGDTGRPLHILYATKPSPWEPHNIPPAIEKIGECSRYYVRERLPDAAKLPPAIARERCDEDFVRFVRELHARKPIDIVLSYLCGSHLSGKAVAEVGRLGIATALFHLDDRLHFDSSRLTGFASGPKGVATDYDVVLTVSDDSIVKYAALGARAVFWPEGANPDAFHPAPGPFQFDVSFVGAKYGHRGILVDFLRRRGVNVACFGAGWENGGVSQERMVEIFSRSRVTLGFGYIGYSDEQHFKGRDFEVPMSGGLYLTSANRYLAHVYDIGREILTYESPADCLTQIRRLLADPDRAETIRAAGLARARAYHTWQHRIQQMIDGFCGLGPNPFSNLDF
jgi:glycosyltransferase involved in cell wall biosynthesis